MAGDLIVLLAGQIVGTVWQDQHGNLNLSYDAAWRDDPTAYPLSLSLPLARRDHGDVPVRSFLEGLLPDSEAILRSWGRRFGVSHRNPFALLRHVGEDVAGAAQFVHPENLEELEATNRGHVRWLTEADVEERLRRLQDDRSAWRDADDPGFFSLAGAQAKTALLYDGERWGVPHGRIPTSHILKPPMEGLDGVVENEHVCLQLAKAVGLPAATSEVQRFGDQTSIVLARYDRVELNGEVMRIHQEDMCQALGVRPADKYENQGGPGAVALIQLLREHSSDGTTDISTFLRALAFNWVVGGSDAHGKNYSILLAPGSEVRLAPLYDVISVLPYPAAFYPPRLKLAMKIGGEYRWGHIRSRHWQRLADSSQLDRIYVVQQVREICEAVAESISGVCEKARDAGLDHGVIGHLEQSISAQLHTRRAALEGE